jgi:hypothetical protein
VNCRSAYVADTDVGIGTARTNPRSLHVHGVGAVIRQRLKDARSLSTRKLALIREPLQPRAVPRWSPGMTVTGVENTSGGGLSPATLKAVVHRLPPIPCARSPIRFARLSTIAEMAYTSTPSGPICNAAARHLPVRHQLVPIPSFHHVATGITTLRRGLSTASQVNVAGTKMIYKHRHQARTWSSIAFPLPVARP